MEKNLKEANQFKGPHVAWQRLPRFMRRRAAAHDPKRLPRKMRSFAFKSNELQEKKVINRRNRRKNSDFGRRQVGKKWMETHVWHAKRMKMVILWGFKIPWTPNLKSTKALYRANSKYAAIYDTSYYTSVFLIGRFDNVAGYLNAFLDPLYPIKSREGGNRMIYSEFPNCKIGPVSFFWGDDRCWLSVHPAILTEILDLFEKNQNAAVKVQVSDEYARFELTGPQSLSVLKGSLNLAHHREVNSIDLNFRNGKV
jgi:ribonuclease P/MRP protein subunit POP1